MHNHQDESDSSAEETGLDYVECEECQMIHLCHPIIVDGTDINVLRTILKRRTPLARGDLLFKKGDPFQSMYAISAGALKITTTGHDGEERVIGFHFAGELAGSYAIYNQRYPYSVEALEPSSICEIPYNAMQRFSTHIPEIASNITMLMSEEIQYTQQLLAMHSGKVNAEERLASFLLSLSERFQKHGYPHTKFKLSMTRADIGSYLGLTKETISRLFSQFKKEGLIAASGKHLELIDLTRLESIAND